MLRNTKTDGNLDLGYKLRLPNWPSVGPGRARHHITAGTSNLARPLMSSRALVRASLPSPLATAASISLPGPLAACCSVRFRRARSHSRTQRPRRSLCLYAYLNRQDPSGIKDAPTHATNAHRIRRILHSLPRAASVARCSRPSRSLPQSWITPWGAPLRQLVTATLCTNLAGLGGRAHSHSRLLARPHTCRSSGQGMRGLYKHFAAP
jgi:hypothetical protein